MESEIYSASTEVRERKVEALHFFLLWRCQLCNSRSFIRLPQNSHHTWKKVVEVRMKWLTRTHKWNLRNSVFSVHVRANGNTASIRMYLEHTTQLLKVQYTEKCSYLCLEDRLLQG